MSDETLDRLARRLVESLPQGLRAAGEDIEKNFRAILKNSLERLDLVTRDQLEAQEAKLELAREKLEALDARLAALESADKPAKRGAGRGGKKKATKKKARRKVTKKKS